MAWTNLTYAFGSKLTSTQMTQNQANFAALAAGDAGAPDVQKNLKSATVTTTTSWADFKSANSISDAVILVGILAAGAGGGGGNSAAGGFIGAGGNSGYLTFGFAAPTGNIVIGTGGTVPGGTGVASSFAGISANGGLGGGSAVASTSDGVAATIRAWDNGVIFSATSSRGQNGSSSGAVDGAKGPGAHGGDTTTAGDDGQVTIFWID